MSLQLSFEFALDSALDGVRAAGRRARAPRPKAAASKAAPAALPEQLCLTSATAPPKRLPPPPARPPLPAAPGSDEAGPPALQESRHWRADGWRARLVPTEDEEAWVVEMCREGAAEAVLVAPWRLDRDHGHPRPLDQSAFDALRRAATELLQRQARQWRSRLHQRVSVAGPDGPWEITLDIVPDEYEPHALLTAFDASGAERAQHRVMADFPLTAAAARAWMDKDFRHPGEA